MLVPSATPSGSDGTGGARWERLMAERDRWPRIAAAGREWALREYSPGAVTERFLGVVKRM